MTPAVGQRWIYNERERVVFIAEVIAIENDSFYKMRVLQNIKGKNTDYSSNLTSDRSYTWEYLPGQDKEK